MYYGASDKDQSANSANLATSARDKMIRGQKVKEKEKYRKIFDLARSGRVMHQTEHKKIK